MKMPANKSYYVLILFSLSIGCSSTKFPDLIADKDFCAAIHRDTTTSLSEQLEPVKQLMLKKTGVYSLEEGDEAMTARAWLSEYAEETIDVQYFIFSLDNVGLIALDYLIRAADRGVKVRLLIDDLLIEADIDDILEIDAHENISIKIYNPSANVGKNISGIIVNLAANFRGFNQRMHNKTFTVDGKVSITGGRNIADEYFDYNHEYNFRDRDVLLLGKTVTDVQNSFNAFWDDPLSQPISELVDLGDYKLKTEEQYYWLHQYACNPENFWPQVREKIKNIPNGFKHIQASGDLQWLSSISYVSDAPGKNDGNEGLSGGGICTDTLVALIKNAKSTIDIQSPYLVTNQATKDLFNEAIERGVKIRILTNSLVSTDGIEAFNAYQRDRRKLLKAGIEIHEFRPDAKIRYKIMTSVLQKELDFAPIFGLHSKTMVIDNKISVIGTFNLDPRSINLNTECIVVIRSEKVTADLLEIIEEEFLPENSWLITEEFNPDSEAGWWKRFKTWSKGLIPKSIL